jgi:phosphate starvation-inducible protein PhoH
VVTGDVTQVDLPEGRGSGLAEARDLLANVEGIGFCHFTDVDVVRHPLVQKIIVAYEARDRRIRSGSVPPKAASATTGEKRDSIPDEENIS